MDTTQQMNDDLLLVMAIRYQAIEDGTDDKLVYALADLAAVLLGVTREEAQLYLATYTV